MMKATCLGLLVVLGLAAAPALADDAGVSGTPVPSATIVAPMELPKWNDGSKVPLPAMTLPPRAPRPRDLRWLYAIGGLLVIAAVFMYNRKVKATLAAADAADAAASKDKSDDIADRS